MRYRASLRAVLNDPSAPWFRLVNGILLGATALSILDTVLYLWGYVQHTTVFLGWIEWPLAILFTGEYVARVWTTDAKSKYILSPMGITDLVSVIPTYLGLESLAFLKAARFARTMRLFRMASLGGTSRFISIRKKDAAK